MARLIKFGHPIVPDSQSFCYGPIYSYDSTRERLCIGASENGSQLLLRLAERLEGPFAILYLLVVPRGETEGRYQSPWMDFVSLQAWFSRFAEFLDRDGRHHVWIFSHTESATLVYDRHNLIWAYGPIPLFVQALSKSGFSAVDEIRIPAPHSHLYHPEFDPLQNEIVWSPDWIYSELRPGDEI